MNLVALLVLVVVFIVPIPSLFAGDPFNGEKVFQRYCHDCHGRNQDESMPGTPDFSWRGIGNNGLHLTDPELQEKILAGGGSCPSFRGILSKAEVQDVITHLRSLR